MTILTFIVMRVPLIYWNWFPQIAVAAVIGQMPVRSSIIYSSSPLTVDQCRENRPRTDPLTQVGGSGLTNCRCRRFAITRRRLFGRSILWQRQPNQLNTASRIIFYMVSFILLSSLLLFSFELFAVSIHCYIKIIHNNHVCYICMPLFFSILLIQMLFFWLHSQTHNNAYRAWKMDRCVLYIVCIHVCMFVWFYTDSLWWS